MSGALTPGDQLLTVPELSAKYQVSLNTARQALALLANQGLLTIRRGVSGGSFVTVPSHDQITRAWQTSLTVLTQNAHLPVTALLDFREALEVPATGMAARLRTDDDLAAIRATLSDPNRWDRLRGEAGDRAFHSSVLAAAHNPLFELVADPIRRVLRDRLLRDEAPAGLWDKVDRDHHEIYGYLELGDEVGARESSAAHLQSLRGIYEALDRERLRSQRA